MAVFKEWTESRWPVWAARVLRFWSRLVRIRLIGAEQAEGLHTYAVAHWHGDELALLPHFGSRGLTLLVSQSKDGTRMAKGAQFLGYKITRGSSTRRAVGGLLALMKALNSGDPVVLAVDGPRGPRGVCKPGIIRLGQKTGVPLFPIGVAAQPKYVFKKTWNQVYLPLPFGRQVIFVDKPVFFPATNSDEEIEVQCRRVEEALREARARAEEILLHKG